MDWNNDGRTDLVLGDSWQYVYYALNTGGATPVFGPLQHAISNGSWLRNPGSSKPTVFIVDWDNDGRKDLITGGELTFPDVGYMYLYLNVGTDANPTFAPAQTIDSSRNFGWRTSPVAVDWDGDARKDLVVTSVYGDTKFYKNVGTDAAPTFAETFHTAPYVQTESGSLNWGMETRVRTVDWDGDGRDDLLIGDRFGEVRLYLKNHPRDADAGADVAGAAGTMALLNGNQTTDPEGDQLTYQWDFTSKPAGSGAVIVNPGSAIAGFVPDLPGTYEVRLRVGDGHGAPGEDTRTVTVAEPPRVTGVLVCGSGWSPAFLTFLEQQGLGDAAYGCSIPSGPAQLDELPWVNIDRISIAFSDDVNVTQGDLAVHGVNVPQYA